MSNLIPNDYPKLLAKVKERVASAQYAALKTVNTETKLQPVVGEIGWTKNLPITALSKAQRGSSPALFVFAKLLNIAEGHEVFGRCINA